MKSEPGEKQMHPEYAEEQAREVCRCIGVFTRASDPPSRCPAHPSGKKAAIIFSCVMAVEDIANLKADGNLDLAWIERKISEEFKEMGATGPIDVNGEVGSDA